MDRRREADSPEVCRLITFLVLTFILWCTLI